MHDAQAPVTESVRSGQLYLLDNYQLSDVGYSTSKAGSAPFSVTVVMRVGIVGDGGELNGPLWKELGGWQVGLSASIGEGVVTLPNGVGVTSVQRREVYPSRS